MKNPFLYLPLIITLGLFLIFGLKLGRGGDNSVIPSALISKPAPVFNLPKIEGLAQNGLSSDDLKGQITVVNVWASWCGPCRVEHPFIEELGRRDDISLVGINYKDKAPNARRFLELLGNPYEQIGADQDGRVGIDFGVYGVPETYIIDPNGIVRYKHVGPINAEILQGEMNSVITDLKAGL